MVRVIVAALGDFIEKNRITLLELAGIILLAFFVATVAGPVWVLLVLAVAALLKSAELDARTRGRGERR